MARPCWSYGPEKSFRPCWMRRTGIDPSHPAGPLGGAPCGVDRQALHVVRHSPAHGLLHTGETRAEGRSPLCRSDQEDDRGGAVLRISDRGLAPGLQQEHGAEGSASLSDRWRSMPHSRSRVGRFASAPWACGPAFRPFLQSQLRRTRDGRPISPASGPARTAGLHWPWWSTATPASCWAGTCRSRARPRPPAPRWNMP